jgi:hypothetical protein
VGNTPSEPGQPTPPKLDGRHCPICGRQLVVRSFTGDDLSFARWLECPRQCALAADAKDQPR